jgi:sarcosine oxidase gamma subunit
MQTCISIQQKYLQAQVAYNTASDLETAAFAVGAAPDTLTKYQAAENQLLTLFQDFQTVGKQFNVGASSP